MSASPPASRPAIRVVLADDAYLVREALKHLLAGTTVEVVGECAERGAVAPVVDATAADLLITDIRMPPTGRDEGIQLATQFRTTHPTLGVIVLSTYAEVAYALRLFREGSDGRGYLLKDRIRDRAQILTAVETVAAGGSLIDPKVVEDLVRARSAEHRSLDVLSPRELETLSLVAEGRSNAAIAKALFLTKGAVEKNVGGIFAKLGLGPDDAVDRRVTAALRYLAGGS